MSNELPKAGFTPIGIYFYRFAAGSVVLTSVRDVKSEGVDSLCEKITGSIIDFNIQNTGRVNAFVFVIPDTDGSLKKGSPDYQALSSTYVKLSKLGYVVEIEIVDLAAGDVARIGGLIDRQLNKIVTGLGAASAAAVSNTGSLQDVPGVIAGTAAAAGDVSANGETGNPANADKNKKQSLRYFGPSNMIVIYVLIALNVLVFIAGVMLEAKYGADYLKVYGIQSTAKIYSGEVWRLLSAMFLHADIYHLSGNMLSLFYLGMVVSRFFTKTEVLITYFLSGIVGNVLSLAFLPANINSLGASGAVLGFGGVLIYMLVFSENKREFRSAGNFFSLGLMVVYNLVYGVVMTGSNINNFAHFGGFIAGFLMALLFERVFGKSKRQGDQ